MHKGGAITWCVAAMSQSQAMRRVCLCLPPKLAKLGEAVVSKCSDAASQRVKFTQCDVDDPGTGHAEVLIQF